MLTGPDLKKVSALFNWYRGISRGRIQYAFLMVDLKWYSLAIVEPTVHLKRTSD